MRARSFEQILYGTPDLGEAAAAFLQIKYASSPEEQEALARASAGNAAMAGLGMGGAGALAGAAGAGVLTDPGNADIVRSVGDAYNGIRQRAGMGGDTPNVLHRMADGLGDATKGRASKILAGLGAGGAALGATAAPLAAGAYMGGRADSAAEGAGLGALGGGAAASALGGMGGAALGALAGGASHRAKGLLGGGATGALLGGALGVPLGALSGVYGQRQAADAEAKTASAYFLRQKYASKAVAPPDTTGALEGAFAIPTEKVLAIMGKLVQNEFATIFAYHVYANSLRDLARDAIAKHFEEHADEELEHVDFLLRRMSVLGGPVHLPDVPSPPACADATGIIQTLIRMEQEGIAGWRELLAVVGENPMRPRIEEYAAQEQEHLDDLWQLLPAGANRPILQQKVAMRKQAEGEGMLDPYTQQLMGAQLLNKRNMGAVSALSGAIPGAIAGGLGAAHLSQNPYARAAGAMGGALLGAAPGAVYAAQKQNGYENLYNPEMKMASAVLTRMRKLAFEGDANMWLAQERMLGQMQEQAESDYFKDQAQQAQAQVQQKDQELQGMQQQLQAIQQQQQQMQQELDQSGQIQRQVLDQARQVEQAATQAAASAHQTATASMLQSMQQQQEVLRHKGMTANMQQNVQSWKDQLMQIAQQDPTAGAGEQVGMPGSGPVQPAPAVDPMTGQPVAPDPMAQGADPNQPPADPNQQPPADPNQAQPPADPNQAQQPPAQEAVKQSSIFDYYRTVSRQKTASFGKAEMIGAGIGALTGGITGYMTSRTGRDADVDARMKTMQQQQDKGEGTFSDAIALAKMHMQQGAREALHNHPIMGTATSAVAGGAVGAELGTAISHLPETYKKFRNFAQSVHKAAQNV